MPIMDLYCDQNLWYLFSKYLWYRLEQGLSGGRQKILILKKNKINTRKDVDAGVEANEGCNTGVFPFPQ